jgi:flagellin FlaB
MFENIERDADERGQVGIGTLIVFIALVLVAAIAAGVLINTAGFLQSQAESTGEESTNQVSDRLNVDSVVGVDTTDDDDLEEVKVIVSLAPGSNPINLDQATYQYVGQTEKFLSPDDADYSAISGASGTKKTLEGNDKTAIVFDGMNNDLAAGDTATLTISTASGSETVVSLNVPQPIPSDKLDGDGAVRL